jgi:branched-chain amino acid transport system ATP-binding protein
MGLGGKSEAEAGFGGHVPRLRAARLIQFTELSSGGQAILGVRHVSEPVLLEVNEIEVSFGGVRAVQGVSVSVDAGLVYGVIGPNGAGKTTLFDAIFGYNRPSGGSVVLQGVDITRKPTSWRARQGMRRTFQRQQTVGSLSVRDNIIVGTEWHGGGGGPLTDLIASPIRRRLENQRREAVDDVLESFGLSGVADARADSLPIGHARLLELARAVIDRPVLLLLDEPTSGMASKEVETVQRVMRQVREDYGTTVLVVEHDVPFIMEVCDRIMVLDLGSVVADGTPDEIRHNEEVKRSYFGQATAADAASPG